MCKIGLAPSLKKGKCIQNSFLPLLKHFRSVFRKSSKFYWALYIYTIYNIYINDWMVFFSNIKSYIIILQISYIFLVAKLLSKSSMSTSLPVFSLYHRIYTHFPIFHCPISFPHLLLFLYSTNAWTHASLQTLYWYEFKCQENNKGFFLIQHMCTGVLLM